MGESRMDNPKTGVTFLTFTEVINKHSKTPNGKSKIDTAEKQATLGTIHRTKTQRIKLNR